MEGIAARALVHTEQRLPRELPAESVVDEAVEGSTLSGPMGVGSATTARSSTPGGPGRRAGPRRLPGASHSERERLGGGCVEPLDVVHGDERRGGGVQDVADADGERPAIDAVAGLAQQRDLERPAPERRERGERVVQDDLEEVAEPRVCEPVLRLGRSCGEDAEPVLARRREGGAPERRLPDPGLAFEHDRHGIVAQQQALDQEQLGVAADDLLLDERHPPASTAAPIAPESSPSPVPITRGGRRQG